MLDGDKCKCIVVKMLSLLVRIMLIICEWLYDDGVTNEMNSAFEITQTPILSS